MSDLKTKSFPEVWESFETNTHLSPSGWELAPALSGLPRRHRALPSASLDENLIFKEQVCYYNYI